MEKLIKVLPIVMIVLTIFTVASPVLATVGGLTISPDTNSGEKVKGLGDKILGIIQVVGTIISVGVLMVLGIKYMMGSAEEKAEYKKTMLPYVIGAVFVFAATNIVGYIYNIRL